jgi:hypothetical protein
MAQYKLGKGPVVTDPRTLRYGAYRRPRLLPPPPIVDHGKVVAQWPMYQNDQYADCTIAAAAHMIQCWTANAHHEITPPDADVFNAYKHFTTPGPENGCDMLTVLKYWHRTGMLNNKITLFATLELKNIVEAKEAVELFCGCYIGVALPNFAMQEHMALIPWVVPPTGPVGDAAPNKQNGHCVCAIAYDPQHLYVVTWGQIKAMTWDFYAAYCEEAYVVLSADYLDRDKSPEGLDLAQLKHDLGQLVGIS